MNQFRNNQSQFNIRGDTREKADLIEVSFFKHYAGLPNWQIATHAVLIVISAGVIGSIGAYIGIWSTALLAPENVSDHGLMPGIILISLALIELWLIALRGFPFTIGVMTLTLTVLGILSVSLRTSSMAAVLIYAALTMILELVALWFGGLTIASAQIHSKSLLVAFWIASLLGIGTVLMNQVPTKAHVDALDFGIASGVLFTSTIIGFNAFKPSSQFSGIIHLAINLAALGGTSFRQANLTDVDFSWAILKHTDFRDANLTRTYWRNAKGLEFARLGNTYLANPKIRQLVVTCNGQGQNFDGLDLTGVNLQDATLQDASFIGASLNQSNLRGADLSRAILKQTQLEGADLTGARLTGAYIEDWGITSTTKLENVTCEYVYMRVPTKENPNPLRKPDNLRETFAEGEFADFIQPFFDTLDLYHSQDVDPRAISIALRNLSANHPDDDLQFVAMERRGTTGLNLRFTTTSRVNKSELSHEYFANYAQIKKELPIAVQMQLAEQDAEIRTLKGTIEQFIQTGTHQSTIQAETIQVIQGELVMTENRGININAGDNANISGLVSGDGVVNLGTISGNVTNAINQLPETEESDQLNLKSLLTQLQQAIETDTNLPDPDKSDLLEQVQVLAEAKKTEEPAKREGIARKAMKMFDATLKGLPDTAKLAEACSKLLPLILKALGFPA